MNQTKKTYLSPHIEVIKLENEATVMTGSVIGMPNTDWTTPSTKSMHSAPSANNSDLEDMINDILTIEN